MTAGPTHEAPPATPGSWADLPSMSELPSVTLQSHDRTWRFTGPDPQDHIFRWLEQQERFYEQEMLDFLAALVPAGGMVADVGANIGNHAVWFAGVMGCRVRAFEPIPLLSTILARNVAQNQLDALVRVEPYGVGSRPSWAHVASWDRTNAGASSLELRRDKGDIRVVALDDLTWDQPVDLLKIDVEGMESEVLAGALGLIRRHRPILAVEARTAADEESLREWLDGAGYRVLARLNATPTLVAVAGGAARREAVMAHAFEALIRRFDNYETRLDRFGRYLQGLIVPAPSTPVDGTAAPTDDARLHSLQERIKHLEAELDAIRRREASTNHDHPSAEDQA